MGCEGLDEQFRTKADISTTIHDFLVNHIGAEKAIFNSSFDLPFLAVADAQAPIWDLPPLFNGADTSFGRHSTGSSDHYGDWRTLPDGRKFPISN